MNINKLFKIKNGIKSTDVTIYSVPILDSIPFLRPAKLQQRTISGWVLKSELKKENIFPKESLFVSTNGEGSHSYSYVSQFEFACNTDVSVLTPRDNMSLNEKIYYALCITNNRYKFSYGRKPKGNKLKQLKLPTEIPKWVNNTTISNKENVLLKNIKQKNNVLELNHSEWQSFGIGNLFTIETTKGTTTDVLKKGHDVPYIAAKKGDNGLSMICSRNGNKQFISKGNCIVFIQLGQGSAGYSLYQRNDFIGMNGKTACGYNNNLNKYNGLFIVSILDLERPKFSFGRSWTGDRLISTSIKLPTKEINGKYEPDWKFMENYIKSLRYSKSI